MKELSQCIRLDSQGEDEIGNNLPNRISFPQRALQVACNVAIRIEESKSPLPRSPKERETYVRRSLPAVQDGALCNLCSSLPFPNASSQPPLSDRDMQRTLDSRDFRASERRRSERLYRGVEAPEARNMALKVRKQSTPRSVVSSYGAKLDELPSSWIAIELR